MHAIEIVKEIIKYPIFQAFPAPAIDILSILCYSCVILKSIKTSSSHHPIHKEIAMKKNIIQLMAALMLIALIITSILVLLTNLPKPTPLSKEEIVEIEKEIAKNTTPIYADGRIVGYEYKNTLWKFPKDDPSLSIESWTTSHFGEKDGYKYEGTDSSIGFHLEYSDKSQYARRLP
jgi:hypothetical protein